MQKRGLCILDWNGTLQDDMHHIYECGVQRIFRHFALPCPSLDTYRAQVAADFMRSFYWPNGIPSHITAADLNAIMAAGFKEKGAPASLFPDAVHFVETLAARGYTLVVASGYDAAKLRAAVARSGLSRHFQKVVGDVRRKIGVFDDLQTQYALPNTETIVVGDTTEDIDGALAIGATPYIVTCGFHSAERLREALVAAGNRRHILAPTLSTLLPFLP